MKLEIEQLSKIYPNRKQALQDITLTLETGVYALFGENGAGKTTLMKILAGLLRPSQGMIRVDGHVVSPLEETYRERIGYLPQETPIYGDFTAKQFLTYLAVPVFGQPIVLPVVVIACSIGTILLFGWGCYKLVSRQSA